MTRTDLDRRKRQMNRRIREVLAVRRSLAADRTLDEITGSADDPAAPPAP